MMARTSLAIGSRRTRSISRSRKAGIWGSSAREVLEHARLEVLGLHSPWPGDERLDLPAAHEPSSAQLDALELAGPRPAADRRRREPDIGLLEDLGGFRERDPVGGGRHRRGSVGGGRRGRRAGRALRRSPLVAGATVLLVATAAGPAVAVGLGRRPRAPRRRGAVLLGPAAALVVDRGGRELLLHRPLQAAGRAE